MSKNNNRSLYLECYSGISGDMMVAALLDLGADESRMRSTLNCLGLEGYRIETGRVKKCGIDAYDFHVILQEEQRERGMQLHQHEHAHQNGHSHEHGRLKEENHTANHSHVCEQQHRTYGDICEILKSADLDPKVYSLAIKIFGVIAAAEAQVHQMPLDQVHFHEVGAVDSIVDIVAAAVCLIDLGIKEVIVNEIWEGKGTTWCQHGKIPVPAPAVLEIVKKYQLPLTIQDTNGEMVTPTGAAIAAAIQTKENLPKKFYVKKVGIGAGKKDFSHANILRVMLLEYPQDSKNEAKSDISGAAAEAKEGIQDKIWVLETNVDDCSGEQLGYVMEHLLSAGARDACCFPMFMKKRRPAYMLQVLCKKEAIVKMEEIIFKETTSIGLRKYEEVRTILDRDFMQVETQWGNAVIKVCSHKNQKFYYPEYESIKKICEKSGLSYSIIYDNICSLAQDMESSENRMNGE